MDNTLGYGSLYAEQMKQAMGEWLERVLSPSHSLHENRRFYWSLPPDIAAAQEVLKSNTPAPVRATLAMVRAKVLFQEAVRLSVGDFAALAMKSSTIQMKNAVLERPTLPAFDPSMMQSVIEMQKLMTDMMASATKESLAYMQERYAEILPAMLTWDFERVAAFWEKQVTVLDIVVNKNPRALKAIRAEMGCKWNDTSRFTLVAETPRANLYQVLPTKKDVQIRIKGKPVMHFAPLILQPVILDLLPKEGLSYVGAFADSGTPTYFMHTKDIETTPEAQVLNEEDLLLDLEYFAGIVHERHGKKVTLNGTCQGALPLLHAVCSKSLNIGKHVDTWIGLVPAYALSASKRVAADMEKIPESKRGDLKAITKKLDSGNLVVPGEIASFATRLKTDPWTALIRAMQSAEKGESSHMALAIQEYLQSLIPMSFHMMEMSHRCATLPITEDGVFPTTLFGESVSLAHAIAQGIRLHVVAGEKDEVVDLDAALRMFAIPCIANYAGASHHVVPGVGHIALMTTCARESSKNFIGNKGGPLWYHLEAEAKLLRNN